MTRIRTPPDLESDRSVPKVLIRNCDLDMEQLKDVVNHLGSKNLDIYVYHDDMNDIQWFEGIRTMSLRTYDFREAKGKDLYEWFQQIEKAYGL